MTSHISMAAAIAGRAALVASSAMQGRSMQLTASALAASNASPYPSFRDALSGIFGSVSLTAWICLLLPQLIQNYKAQSAEGLSMAFLFVWLVGDATNLFGALWTGLAPTALALASYFCVADAVLISQCLYYNALTARLALQSGHHRRRSSSTAVATGQGLPDEYLDNEEEAVDLEDEDEGEGGEHGPLLGRRSSDAAGLPGSHRTPRVRRSESNLEPLRRMITGEDETPDSNPWLHNALSLMAVWIVGTVGYFASYHIGAWDVEAPVGGGDGSDGVLKATAAAEGTLARIGLALGYCSAVLYLCARIPQILKNYREKSCEGLALLFFLLSLTGNFTYASSLLSYSQDRAYLLKALPWLMGSVGTMVEDGIIFFQFRIYAPQRRRQSKAVGQGVSSDSSSTDAVGTYGAA